jgi:HEAT repeat protein
MRPSVPSSTAKLLRYDPLKDPRLSGDAAAIYYQRREQMIRAYHGDAQIDNILKGLKSGKDLLKWLGRVQSHEVASALPIVADLLANDDKSVRRVAAETLCSFGDKRGFDFILQQRGQADGFDWASLFQKVFTEHQPAGYNEALIKLMGERIGDKTSQKVDAYGIAEVLAAMGDPASLDVLLPILTQYPPESAEAVLVLRDVNDPRVIQAAKDILQSGKSSKVKQAAEIVLAAHGDLAAQQSILDAAQRLAGLPQLRNADGTYKPGMEPTAIGAATPAWDGDAMLALEQGMENVPAAQAVPVLKHIAMNANNVRFSETAIQVLAKIGDETARDALWETARALQTGQRGFENTIFTSAGKALMMFGDDISMNFARSLFAADKHGLEASQLFAESKGWEGLFKQGLFY